MSSHTTHTAELPLSSPDTNPEEKSEIPHFFTIFTILLIYSKTQYFTKIWKNDNFHKSPNLAQLSTPGEKAKIEKITLNIS